MGCDGHHVLLRRLCGRLGVGTRCIWQTLANPRFDRRNTSSSVALCADQRQNARWLFQGLSAEPLGWLCSLCRRGAQLPLNRNFYSVSL